MSLLPALLGWLTAMPITVGLCWLLIGLPDKRHAKRARAFLARREAREALNADDWRWLNGHMRLAGRTWNYFTEEVR